MESSCFKFEPIVNSIVAEDQRIGLTLRPRLESPSQEDAYCLAWRPSHVKLLLYKGETSDYDQLKST